jgi:hypothetical protein
MTHDIWWFLKIKGKEIYQVKETEYRKEAKTLKRAFQT